MSNLSNNQNSKPSQQSCNIDWEVIRSYEYDQNNLLRTSLLYVFRLGSQKKDGDELVNIINNDLCDTVLFRMDIIKDKLPELEILNGIFPHKFDAKNKDHLALLRSVSRYFISNIGLKLPDKIKNSFTKEYKEAVEMLNN